MNYINKFIVFFVFSVGILSANEEITTLHPGILTVAVTGICTEDSPNHTCWVHKILTKFAEENHLALSFQLVTFDQSWKLPAVDQVDISATGITPLPERQVEGATNSASYSIVKRGLRIRREDQERFQTIHDFVGHRVGAVKGMTSELDLRRRAPQGVEIVTPDTFNEVYELFHQRQIDGIAEGYYVFPGEDINQLDPETMMIDAHDLNPGEREGNTFVIRDQSFGLLDAINAFIKKTGLPHKQP